MLSKKFKIAYTLLFFLSCFLLLSIQKVSAANTVTRPYYQWSKGIHSSQTSTLYSAFEDSTGNLYYFGKTAGNVDFGVDWGVSDARAFPSSVLFVTKINKDLSYAWTRIIPNPYNTSYRANIDKNNNVYVYGLFSGTVNFASEWGIADSKTAQGGTNSFITRINADGTYGYTKVITGNATITLGNLVFDSNNNMYLSGGFTSTVDFGLALGQQTDIKSSLGGSDVFISKINADGNYAWTKRIGGTGNDNSLYYGNNIGIDSNDNVYVSGGFFYTVNFAADWGGTATRTSAGDSDFYIVKLLENGDFSYVHTFGGAFTDNTPSIVFDTQDSYFIVARFRGTVNFGADWGITDIKTSRNTATPDISIIKINNSDQYQWTHSIGSPGSDDPRAVTLDKEGNIYVGGYYIGDTNFAADWNGLDNHSGRGSIDAFMTKINNDGSYAWTKSYGALNDDALWFFKRLRNNELYIGGYFTGEVNIGAVFGGDETKSSPGIINALLVKIIDAEVKINTTAANSFTLYENGAATTYEISLNTVPTSNVVLNISAPGLNLSKMQLTFTPTNWQTPQLITVSVPNDNKRTGNSTKTISYAVLTEDTDFANTTLHDITVAVIDDEKPAVKGISATSTSEVTPTITETIIPTETVIPTITQSPNDPDSSQNLIFTVVDEKGNLLGETRVRIGNSEFVTDKQARLSIPKQLQNQEIKIFINNKEVRGIISENKIVAIPQKSAINIFAVCLGGIILVIAIFFILFLSKRNKTQDN